MLTFLAALECSAGCWPSPWGIISFGRLCWAGPGTLDLQGDLWSLGGGVGVVLTLNSMLSPITGPHGLGCTPKSFLATSFSTTLGHVPNFAERLHFPKSDFSKEQTNLNRFHFAHSRPSSADSVAGGQGVTSGHQPGGTRDVPRLRSERLWCFFFWALNCFRLPFCFFGFVAFPF